MYLLGLNNNHNATAVLLKDGKIVGCVSEERFRGIKNYIGIPRKAIGYLLKENKISSKDLSYVCLGYSKGGPLVGGSRGFWLSNKVRRRLWQLEFYLPCLRGLEEILYRLYVFVFNRKAVEKEKAFLARFLQIPIEKIVSFDHHQAHAAAAYYSSPFREKKVLALTLDAEGDLLCASVNIFDKKGTFERIAATPIGHSLAQIYKDVTRYLGMKPNEHEYKVMGLAPYAKKENLEKVFNHIKNWLVFSKKNPLLFKSKFHTGNTYLVLKKEMEGFRFDNIAAAFQKLIEERVVEWVKQAIKKTSIKTIVFGGGIFMNIKLNQKISELKEIKKVFFMPNCGDESTSIGAAYLGYLQLCQQKGIKPNVQPIKDLYWGPAYSNKEIGKFLKKWGYSSKYQVKKIKNIEKMIAKLLGQDEIVARFAGRMEWGARALGNRSILTNPANLDLVRVLNEQIKNRDFWMPFTPSILAERANDYIINPKNIPAAYMVISFNTTFLARRDLKAAIHPYDFTIRPQVVEEDWNSRYYEIIKEFEKLTGIGGILNTSFNLHGYPIVLGPKEAMDVFENSSLKYLVMENYLITKK